jgi:exopolyphosphatase/guanosine-5'-triphosphate,3'-diphosphate pyrophosphatase
VFFKSGFKFSLPAGFAAVGTGGTLTTLRAVLGARVGQTFEHTDSRLALGELREMLATLGRMPLAERKLVAGLPPPRADVFPTALATMITVAELGGFDAYQNSVFNLRYGLADELLAI